ncbi:hypothetical protein Tco_0737362 [Tanacetum coccineum]
MSNDDDVLYGVFFEDAYKSDPKATEAVRLSVQTRPSLHQLMLQCIWSVAPSDDDLEPPEAQPFTDGARGHQTEEPLRRRRRREVSAPADSPTQQDYTLTLPSEAEEDRGLFYTTITHFSSPYHPFIPNWTPFAAPSHRFEIGESSAAAAARKPGSAWDDSESCIVQNSAAVAARQPGSALTKGTEFGFVTSLEESRRPRTLNRLGLTPWIISVGCRLRSEYYSSRGEMM